VPPPRGNPDAPASLLVANLDASDYVGRIAIAGSSRRGSGSATSVAVVKLDTPDRPAHQGDEALLSTA